MEIFSHILWPLMLFRNKLWREEALFFAILPDISFLFILFYVFFGTPMEVGWDSAMYTMPNVYKQFYFFMHSFVAVGIGAFLMWIFNPKLLPALSAWILHICMDIPMHDGEFATRFLYPISGVSVSGLNWTDYRVMAISYLLLLNFTVYSLWRERKKHRMGPEWKADWVDKVHVYSGLLLDRIPPQPAFAKNLINRIGTSMANAKVKYLRRTPEKLSGEDQEGSGQGDNQPA